MNNKQSKQTQLDAVLNSMSEALIEIGLDYTILRANKAVETMLGVLPSSLLNRSALDFARKFSSIENEEQSILNALKYAEGVLSGDCVYSKSNGQELYLRWVLSPLEFQGAARGRLLTLVDLSERHELRVAIMHEREDFLAVLNHRLRTPVLATDRIIRLILDGQFGSLSKQHEELLSLLGENISEINRLMIMIMDIYRYRNGTKNLSLREVEIEKLLLGLLPNIPTGKVPIKLQIDCPNTLLLCDETQINCMLLHLIENAVKYASNSVRIHSREIGLGLLEICVEDDGKGIAEEDIKNLFDRFYLVSASGKYAPVTGAGLCLCAEIAKAHDGKIVCKSTLGQGTRFEILMPVCYDGKVNNQA